MTNHYGTIPRALRGFAAALALCGAAAYAAPGDGLPYTYLDVDLVSVDAGGGSETGLGVSGSLSFNDLLYGVAGISDVDDTTSIGAGVGLRGAISDRLHVFGEVQLLSVDTGAGSETGFSLGGGLRGMVATSLELFGRIDHVEFDAGSDDSLTVGGYYYFSRIGVGAAFTSNDSADAALVGVRFTF